MMVTLEMLLNSMGEFAWAWNYKFFIETGYGNYVWHDPDYGGDNTIRKYNGTLRAFIQEEGISVVRDKGEHILRNYCGSEVKAVGTL
jgi:hypothetical protein